MADSDAPTLQIIDQDGKFNTDLKDFMQSNGLMSSGLSYGAVSIIGGQGSGKSTLLNALFGTSFATMTAQRGRSQTTQGIWCSKARDMNIFVLDVEGTDGREAQDDKKAFENKSALLSLALTDVLMVNLWEKEVGRFQAANLPLLRTVFEVHLRLLNSSSGPMKMSQKPLLMFILRDCDGRTPAHELHDTLRLDLEGIWTEIVKPAGHESSVLWDFFELRSIPLPHYVHQFEDWKLVVDKLHNTFADKSDGQFVFQGRDDKAVPADGFADYAEQLWLAIEAEGDLDLPSQRKLLAQFRCRAKVAELLALFDQESVSFIKARTESIPPSLEAARAGVERLLATGRELVDRMVAQYDAETAGYDPTVKEEEKSTLTDTMWSRLHPAFDAKISFCIMLLGDQFTEALGKKLSAKAAQPVALAVEWNALVKAQREESTAQLSALLDQVIPDGAEIWDKGDLLSKLSADLDRCEETSKRRLAEMMLVHTKETLRKRIGHDLSKLLDDAKLDMWTEIARSREQHLETALVTLAPAQAALSEEEDLDSKLAELATEAVHERLHERAKQRSMLDTVFRRFDAEFNREKTRGWTQFDRPAHEFKKARDTAMATFNLFTESQLPGFPSVIYIDEEARRDAEKLIDVRLMAELAWAESAKASASTRNVWFMGGWGLAIILGLDNFLWLLYNPFYLFLFLVILIGAAYYYLHQKLGSYAQVSQLALKKAGEVLANSLPQPPQPPQPPVGTPTSAQSTLSSE